MNSKDELKWKFSDNPRKSCENQLRIQGEVNLKKIISSTFIFWKSPVRYSDVLTELDIEIEFGFLGMLSTLIVLMIIIF